MCSLDLAICPVWREATRTARKQHTCDCCWWPIRPGEQYLYHSHVYDGSAASEKLCALCAFVRDDFSESHRMTPMPSDTFSTIRECSSSGGWRTHLAIILNRRRTSPRARMRLERTWFRNAVARELAATRRYLSL